MKKVLYFLFTILVLASCQDAEQVSEPQTNVLDQETKLQGVLMSVPQVTYEGTLTRTTMTSSETEGLSFTWSDGDATGVYSTTTGFACFNLATGAGLANATFDGGGFSLTDGNTYYAFYPYAMSATDKTAIPLDYTGQSVTTDNDMTSPMLKDYMWSSSVSDEGNASFTFSHIGSFLRLRIGLSAGTAIDKVELVPLYEEVPQTLTFDITNHTPTVSTSSPIMSVMTTGLAVPVGDQTTVWISMPPQSFASDYFAIQAYSGANIYSARVPGAAFNAGKAYRRDLTPVLTPGSPDYGFSTVKETDLKKTTTEVGAGQYSGIAYMGGTQYAVVDDKQNGGGIVFFDFEINNDGTIGTVTKTVPTGTSTSATTDMDNEGIVFVSGSPGTLFVSAEADQSIREYDLTGTPTGRLLTIPADMAIGKISSNKGFEALTYDATNDKFWTITESELVKDAATPGLLRMQSFGSDLLPDNRYLYQMDAATKSASEAAAANQYVFGVPALAALGDGRIIVLEREVYVPNGSAYEKLMNSFTSIKLYIVNPMADTSGILRKTPLKLFTTTPSGLDFANYEGMCIGPTLSDGSHTLVMIPDSQGGVGGLANEFIKVITFK